MAKPSIVKIIPFDATKDYVLSFSYIGNIPYSNRLIIYDGNSLETIWDDTIQSFQLRHTIPANLLRNGHKYAAQIQCFDQGGVPSALSDKTFFLTLATPIYYFQGITDGSVIQTSSLAATIVYNQAEWEDVKSYTFHIYNESKIQLLESPVMYDNENISYIFKGLNNNATYYIRWQGVTDNGIKLDTGYVEIFTKYENPGIYSRMYVNCNEETSAMDYHTNFVLVEAERDDYEYDNGYIFLNNDTLVYDKDYVIEGDATWCIRGRNLFREGTLFRCRNANFEFTLESILVGNGELRYKLTVPNGLCNYILYSEALYFEDFDVVNIWIRRINNVYQLECHIDYGATSQTNMFFGTNRPSSSASEIYDIWIDLDETPTVKVAKDDVVIFYQDNEPEDATLHSIWLGN